MRAQHGHGRQGFHPTLPVKEKTADPEGIDGFERPASKRPASTDGLAIN
jgi:hypothetical protein